jgi:2-isopropylmalate synthase
MTKIQILDNTLHLLQDLESTLTLSEKIKLALELNNLGVKTIDLGRIKTKTDLIMIKEISKICDVELLVVVPLKKELVIQGCNALKFAKNPRLQIHIEDSKSDLQSTLDQILAMTRLVKKHNINVTFSVAEELEVNLDLLSLMIQKAIDGGSDEIALSDSKEYATPDSFSALVKYISQKISNSDKVTILIQCHSHLGLAMANTWSGIVNGATKITATNGLSKISGECDLRQFLEILKFRNNHLLDYSV